MRLKLCSLEYYLKMRYISNYFKKKYYNVTLYQVVLWFLNNKNTTNNQQNLVKLVVTELRAKKTFSYQGSGKVYGRATIKGSATLVLLSVVALPASSATTVVSEG